MLLNKEIKPNLISIYLSMFISKSIHIYLSIYPYLSKCNLIYRSLIYLSIYLSLFVSTAFCLQVSNFVHIYLFICLILFLSTHVFNEVKERKKKKQQTTNKPPKPWEITYLYWDQIGFVNDKKFNSTRV